MGVAWRCVMLLLVVLLMAEHSTGGRYDETYPVDSNRQKRSSGKETPTFPTAAPSNLSLSLMDRGARPTRRPNIVNETQKEIILRAHNTLRQKVARGEEMAGAPGPQPPAANMRKMVWDEELALMAQCWVNSFEEDEGDACNYVNRFDHCSNVTRFDVIHNWSDHSVPDWAMVMSANVAKWEIAISRFYNVLIRFNPALIAAQMSDRGSTYANMVMAESYLIGCGYSTCKLSESLYTRFLCNYGPVVTGSAMYLVGGACSQCPVGTACSTEYPGLCE